MLSGRSKLAPTAIASASKALASSLLGLVLAYWTWAWCAPSPLPRSLEVPEAPARLAAAGGLFGAVAGSAPADAPTGLAVSLLGLVAGQPAGSGYALLRLGAGETRVVRAGGELAPGIRVETVLPQRVILQRHGSRETLAWPNPAQAPATASGTPVR
jgi:general secretion pathway protein C